MSAGRGHPVWDVYDEARTARLNVHYYEHQFQSVARWNFWIELVLALSVSSGIAGLWFWQTPVGGLFWKSLVSLAAVLAVVKPLAQLNNRAQQTAAQLVGWRTSDEGFRRLIVRISQFGKYDDAMRERFLELVETKSEVIRNEPPGVANRVVVRECFNEVNQELPVDAFFVPEA